MPIRRGIHSMHSIFRHHGVPTALSLLLLLQAAPLAAGPPAAPPGEVTWTIEEQAGTFRMRAHPVAAGSSAHAAAHVLLPVSALPIMAPTTPALCTHASPEDPQPSTRENVDHLGHVGGSTEGVCIAGTTVYCGEGLRLAMLDVTDPATPILLGRSEPLGGVVDGVRVAAGLAYVAAGLGGLRILDVSDPAAPVVVGSADLPNPISSATCLDIRGDYAYIGMNGMGLAIFDVTDPEAPALVSELDPPGYTAGIYYGLVTDGMHVYAADWGGPGVRVIDVQDPFAPEEVGYWGAPSSPFDIVLDDDGVHAHVAGGAGFHVLDVSAPASPMEVGFIPMGAPVLTVTA
ncbi:MAG: hypothetical protein GF330_09170, partial [Candidatus Eisenbacteria bacterium]|nr:hypothetical protein [Candidatus Eisenbacteria bacterium]